MPSRDTLIVDPVWAAGRMHTERNRRLGRRIVAAVCLLAVMMLYAPLGGAAWASYERSCCTSGQCKIPAHHHHKMPAAPADHMDCGHDMPGMMACAMHCCQDSERTFATPIAFVLPADVRVKTAAPVATSVEISEQREFPQANEPVSPPPRLIIPAA